MDATRGGDLSKLHNIFNDPLVPIGRRKNAHRSFQKIHAQMRDRKLNNLRHRLAKANLASDSDATEKLTEEIEMYSMRKGY